MRSERRSPVHRGLSKTKCGLLPLHKPHGILPSVTIRNPQREAVVKDFVPVSSSPLFLYCASRPVPCFGTSRADPLKSRIFFSNAGPAAPHPHSLPVTVTLGVPPRSTQPPLQARPFAAASRSRFRKRSVLVAATKSSGLCPGLVSRRPFLPAKPLPHNATEENSPVSAKYAYATLSFPFAYFASEVRAKENPPGRPRSSVQDSLSRSFSHVP